MILLVFNLKTVSTQLQFSPQRGNSLRMYFPRSECAAKILCYLGNDEPASPLELSRYNPQRVFNPRRILV